MCSISIPCFYQTKQVRIFFHAVQRQILCVFFSRFYRSVHKFSQVSVALVAVDLRDEVVIFKQKTFKEKLKQEFSLKLEETNFCFSFSISRSIPLKALPSMYKSIGTIS